MIGLVIATHCSIASSLSEAAQVVLGPQEAIATVDLPPNAQSDDAWGLLRDAIALADRGGGILVMVDMLGGTPSNLAMALLSNKDNEVLTGVNLPMVLRAIRQRNTLPLVELAADVAAYGQRNVTVASAWLRPAPEEKA